MKLNKFVASKTFYKEVIAVALPLMLQQLIMSSVNLVDNLMVGQLGDAAIGGVGVANRFFMIANFSVNGFIAATAIFIAQYYGAKDDDHLKQTYRFSLFGAIALMTIFTILGIFNPKLIVSFFTSDPVYITQGEAYLNMVAYSYMPAALTMALSSALRTIGETKIPLKVNVIAVFINCFFNYVFIFGHFGFPQMGVVGAALATLISRFVECLMLFFVIKNNDFPFKTKISDLFHVEIKLAERITIKALPLLANEILWSAGMAMLLKLYATRGPDVITAYSVSGTITDIFFSLFGGMAGATAIMIGQRLGANKLEEAKEHAYHLRYFAIFLSAIFGILMYISSYFIPNLYDLTPHTRELAANLIRVAGVLFWIYMINAENYFILRAGGDTKATFIMDSCYMWLFNIPFIAVLAYFTDYNIYIVYIAGQATDLLKMVVSSYFVRRGKWIKNLTIVH